MVKRTTTAAMNATERRLFDKIAAKRFLDCLRAVNDQSREGCAQMAFEDAKVFIAERRKQQPL